MPDITLCSGKNCPLKEECYRFTTEPDDLQSYFLTIPYDRETKECKYLMPPKGEKHDK